MGVSDEIEIRILPDGSVSFSALSAELLRLAESINPRDPNIARRKEALRLAEDRTTIEPTPEPPAAKESARGPEPQ